jgi:selenide,water dikinase
MQGISSQFDTLQCRFLGGHTSEANELSVGLVVNGIQQQTGLFQKRGLNPGDKLVLSKPLGTGVILAAAMQAECDGAIFNQTIASMLKPNYHAATTLSQLNVKACTDVTGFGLLGHLNELCLASNCAASLNINAIPLLPGTEELILQGIKSSLYSQNYNVFKTVECSDSIVQQARFSALFDPQTSGGLLAGIATEHYAELEEDFHRQFYTIGEVIAHDDSPVRIQIEES